MEALNKHSPDGATAGTAIVGASVGERESGDVGAGVGEGVGEGVVGASVPAQRCVGRDLMRNRLT